MWRTQCLFALVALSCHFVNSWDIAIAHGNQIEFYNNETKTDVLDFKFRNLKALAYDAVHNMLLFVDRNNDNASIFSYHLATKKYQPLVRRKSNENIQDIAFDPVQSILFWTDFNEKSIFWKSLKAGSQNYEYGNLLIKMDDEVPMGIAVDSCRGYIYWTNIASYPKPTIERARFDGTERKIIIDTDIEMPLSIAVDQRTKKLYWVDDREGIHYSIESSDLDGKNRVTLLADTSHEPNAIAVSKDAVTWIDLGFRSVWELPKTGNAKPKPIIKFNHQLTPFGIAYNYSVTDQIEGSSDCEILANISQSKNDISDSLSIRRDVGVFCLHGVMYDGKMACNCSPGYMGERCEISVCQNFCFHGDCTLTSEGLPQCRCKSGYTGSRCEVDMCVGHCLNKGVCSINEDHEPVCTCAADFQGSQCEVPLVKTTQEPVNKESCNCSNSQGNLQTGLAQNTEDDFIQPSDYGWDSIRDPIIMVLGILCGLLCVACAVLVTKVMHLKRRPRIKKRIIVNKNVTPLTARPDQCEITIENCCNMNICETPCFEPRSTFRPTLLDSKLGKDEKKNLIANMEHPDDF